jgi:hypothetical protein
MADYLSNQLKAVLFLGDITEGIPMRQQEGLTVQHFDFNCFRPRNNIGVPYGPSNASLMQITLKTVSADGYKELYDRLQSDELYHFSVVFNASFDEFKLLKEYGDAMMVVGYIVEIEEEFDTVDKPKQGMMLSMKILLHTLSMVGKNQTKTIVVNH